PDLAKFLAASLEQREKLLTEAKMPVDPRGRLKFALTYYTGSSDTVPHVPERCFAADGWKPDKFTVPTWSVLPRDDKSLRGVEVRMMNFEDQIASRSFRPMQVCYFFQVNGTYEQDPIFGVRKRLQKLTERSAYFAKIELVTGLSDPKSAEPVMQDFLTHAMPDIERVLPDWQKVNADK
ncbi:MAG: hypothetical protein H7144_10155, partial [Burkholderiales bacterium]|nr:hypothetical protein [Phycisphaerae bacterium]